MTAQIEDVFGRAVQAWRHEPYDADAVDELLMAIVKPDLSAAVEFARSRLEVHDVDIRATAYQLLAIAAQLGTDAIRSAVAELVTAASTGEHVPGVLVGIARALGGAQDQRGLPVLTALATHADAAVRHQVTAELPMVMDDPPDPAGVAALIALSADVEPEIRDWATFALGTQTDADSEAVRAALWARTSDPYVDARDEAVLALARRGDPRIRAIVTELLAQPTVGALVFEAATHLKDPTLLPLLCRFDLTDEDVIAAIHACQKPTADSSPSPCPPGR